MVLLSRSTSSFATNLSSLSPSVSCRPSSFSHGYTLRILALVSEAWNLLYGPWDLKRPTFPAVLQSVPARSLTDVAVAVLPPNALGQTRVCSTVIFHFPQLSTTLPFGLRFAHGLQTTELLKCVIFQYVTTNGSRMRLSLEVGLLMGMLNRLLGRVY